MILEIIFWISLFVIFHSYILYPVLLIIISSNKPGNKVVFNREKNLPYVSIIMSVFNEEEVIKDKINSIFKNDYPPEKYEVIIGSDASTDRTNFMVGSLAKIHKSIRFYPFEQRQGKGNIINQLIEKSNAEILILTDANVMFDNNTIFELIKHFKNKKIGLVDTNMINKGAKKEGISIQEKAYISREVKIKNREGKIWGTMMGPFGGCYAIRKNLYANIPKNFMVDDFYFNMKILEKGQKTINELNAKVYEDVSNDFREEFRRKVRISTGNFQNLVTFFHLLFPPFSGLSFSFFSHKVLRWLGPFFMIMGFIINFFFVKKNSFYLCAFLFQCIMFIIPVIDYLLRKIKIHILILRFITHFCNMNLALFIGFFKFIKGVNTNVWQPTKREQYQ